jgi:hypothetical protein
MTASSRKTSRKALAGLLDTALSSYLSTGDHVTAYPPADFAASPKVFVRSAGTYSNRRGLGQTKGINKFKLEVMIYVAAANDDAGYTPETAADLLDDLEAACRATILANPSNAAWMAMRQIEGDKTEIIHLPGEATGGNPYDVEIIPVEVEVYDT